MLEYVHSFLLLDELDSYMYQTVGHQAIDLYAEAMGLPLYRHTIQGTALDTGRDYLPQEADEVEDLYQLLGKIKVLEFAALYRLLHLLFPRLLFVVLLLLFFFFSSPSSSSSSSSTS